MGSRFSLRTQLAIAIASVAALTLALTFVAVYRATGSDLRHRIDSELRTQVVEWKQSVSPRDLRSPAALDAAARRFIAGQRYHPESRIFVVDVKGGRTVTNHPAIIAAEEAREQRPAATAALADREERKEGRGDGLLDSPPGLATVMAEQAGRLRVESYPLFYRGARVGTLRISAPLSSVEAAETGLQRIFLIVGSIVLLVALVVAAVMAVLIARPLRRITDVAAAVDAGDLNHRVSMGGQRGEIAALGRTFDHMLQRLQRSFARQKQFVSDASHELRTPLAVMQAQVELLIRDTHDSGRREDLVMLLRHLDTMDRLVTDMLTLANAEGGRILERRRIDIGLFLEDTRRDLPLFGDRHYEVDAIGGSVQADPDRLTQVVRNLVRNAVNHTTESDTIRLAARVRGDDVEFAVSDSGPGIPEDELERIFERFHRTDESRRRDDGGSGLGLPIARAIVEAHGGRIWAESRPGGGATIRFTLPGYEPSREAHPPPEPAGFSH